MNQGQFPKLIKERCIISLAFPSNSLTLLLLDIRHKSFYKQCSNFHREIRDDLFAVACNVEHLHSMQHEELSDSLHVLINARIIQVCNDETRFVALVFRLAPVLSEIDRREIHS